MAHWASEHSRACLGTSTHVDSCKAWVSDIYEYLLRKNGQPVPLAEVGLNVKKPAALGKKYKLLSVLQEDIRFKWFQAPTRAEDADKPASNNNMAYLAVAVEGSKGELVEGCISRNEALSLVSGCGKTAGDAQEQAKALEPARLPPDVGVMFVSCPESLAHARWLVEGVLASAGNVPWSQRSGAARVEYVVGLDTEWRPSFKKGESNPSSILQVAFRHFVLIFDLHWIHGRGGNTRADYTHAARNAALEVVTRIFHSEALLKIGFAFLGDLDKLYKDYGTCYSLLRPFVDLQTPLVSSSPQPALLAHTSQTSERSEPSQQAKEKDSQTRTAAAQTDQDAAAPLTLAQDEAAQAARGGGNSGVGNYMSLQALVGRELGFKLIKTERMSNWHARPLSPPQLSYASLDAWILIAVWEKVLAGLEQKRSAQAQGAAASANMPKDFLVLDLAPRCCHPVEVAWLGQLCVYLAHQADGMSGHQKNPAVNEAQEAGGGGSSCSIADLRAGHKGAPKPPGTLPRPLHKLLTDTLAQNLGLTLSGAPQNLVVSLLQPHTSASALEHRACAAEACGAIASKESGAPSGAADAAAPWHGARGHSARGAAFDPSARAAPSATRGGGGGLARGVFVRANATSAGAAPSQSGARFSAHASNGFADAAIPVYDNTEDLKRRGRGGQAYRGHARGGGGGGSRGGGSGGGGGGGRERGGGMRARGMRG